jgi:Domain of unknown function (DUF4397)
MAIKLSTLESESVMNLQRFLLLGAAAGIVGACSDSTSPKNVVPDAAGLVRFINAVPDTASMDFRFIDVLEGVPNVEFVNLAYRGGTQVALQRTSPGSHHIRVFMNGNSTDPAVVSTVMADTTVTFQPDVAQTFIFYGASRAASQKFLITTDSRPALTKTSATFGYRAVNLTAGPVDVYLVPGNTLTSTPTGTAVIANLAANSASAYITPAVAVTGSNYSVVVTTAGTLTVVSSVLLPAGTAYVPEVPGTSGALDATAGSRISASVLSSFIFPPSVAGSRALSFTTPGLGTSIDKNPPSGP